MTAVHPPSLRPELGDGDRSVTPSTSDGDIGRDHTRGEAVLRIAQVLVGFRSDGGAEQVVRTLLEELRHREVETTVITLHRTAHGDVDELHRLGSALVRLPARRLVDPVRFARLVRTLRRGRFDIVHTHLTAANILGVLAARILRIPAIVTLHSTESRADDHWYHGRLERFVLRHFATTLLAVGEETAVAQRTRIGRCDIVVLPNAVAPTAPIDAAARDELRRAVMADPGRRLILTVGRLELPKAHADLLVAFADLVDLYPDAELAIVGRGSLRDETEELAMRLGLSDRVHLLGVRSDVRALMQAADVFALSSRWEGLPMVLLEAMDSRLPVVSTDVGDVARLLEDTAGRLVTPGEPSALTAALRDALVDLDHGRDLASAGAHVVHEQYSSLRWAHEVLTHYRAACR